MIETFFTARPTCRAANRVAGLVVGSRLEFTLRVLHPSPLQSLANPSGGVRSRGGGDVGVDVGRGRDVRMAELLADDVQPHAGLQRDRRVTVTRTVQRDRRDLRGLHKSAPPAEDRIGLHHRPYGLCDDPRALDAESAVGLPRRTPS